MSENNSGLMMGGFLLGAVAGAALALLFAPMAGDETRRHIGETTRKLKNLTGDGMDDVKGMIKDGADNVGAAVAAGKDAFRRGSEKSPIAKRHI